MSRMLSLWPGLMLGLLVVAAPAQAARTTIGPVVDFTASGPTDQVIGSGITSTSINVWYGINPNATLAAVSVGDRAGRACCAARPEL